MPRRNESSLVRDPYRRRKETSWNDYAWSKHRSQIAASATETTPIDPQAPPPASSASSEEKQSSQKRLKAKFVYVRKCADAAEADAHRATGLAAARAKSKTERAALGMTPSQYDTWKWETRFAKLVDPDYYADLRMLNRSPMEDV